MKALLKIEWIKTWRSWPVFIMSMMSSRDMF